MKCQNLFYFIGEKKKKKYFKMSSADILPSMLSVLKHFIWNNDTKKYNQNKISYKVTKCTFRLRLRHEIKKPPYQYVQNTTCYHYHSLGKISK